MVSLSVINLNLEAFQKWLFWGIDPQLHGLLPVEWGCSLSSERISLTVPGPTMHRALHQLQGSSKDLGLLLRHETCSDFAQTLHLCQWLTTLPLHTSGGGTRCLGEYVILERILGKV